MGLVPGKTNLTLVEGEKTAEASPSIEEVSKATGELQLHLNVCLVAETMSISIPFWVWGIILTMDAHCVGGIHAFVTSGLDWHNALCLSSSQGPAAICAMWSCLIPINILLMQSACMLGKTRGLDHCHLRFCLVRVLSS